MPSSWYETKWSPEHNGLKATKKVPIEIINQSCVGTCGSISMQQNVSQLKEKIRLFIRQRWGKTILVIRRSRWSHQIKGSYIPNLKESSIRWSSRMEEASWQLYTKRCNGSNRWNLSKRPTLFLGTPIFEGHIKRTKRSYYLGSQVGEYNKEPLLFFDAPF